MLASNFQVVTAQSIHPSQPSVAAYLAFDKKMLGLARDESPEQGKVPPTEGTAYSMLRTHNRAFRRDPRIVCHNLDSVFSHTEDEGELRE